MFFRKPSSLVFKPPSARESFTASGKLYYCIHFADEPKEVRVNERENPDPSTGAGESAGHGTGMVSKGNKIWRTHTGESLHTAAAVFLVAFGMGAIGPVETPAISSP